MAISAKEFLQQKIDMTAPEAREPLLKQYVFRVGKACKEGTCVHVAVSGNKCIHAFREGDRYMEPLLFNKCDCAAVKEDEVGPTIPFIFMASPECLNGDCVHSKIGSKCGHADSHGMGSFEAQSYNMCRCRTIKRGSIGETKLFENKNGYTIQGSASDLTKRAMTAQAELIKKRDVPDTWRPYASGGHDYSDLYLPRHCKNCGARLKATGPCLPVPREEVMARVEADLSIRMGGINGKKNYQIPLPPQQETSIYQGNLSPLHPVTWGLIGGPLAQRRRGA
jgi:hypothetical protein